MSIPKLVLFHNPQSRSAGVRILLEELALSAELIPVEFNSPKPAALLVANPLGKVPTLVADGVVVTEQVAIYQFLAELNPAAGLAPLPGDPLRGAFLRALAFYGSSFEPAMIDKALKRDAGQTSLSPYGEVAVVEQVVRSQLATGPWWLGERFSAADVLWGTALSWMTRFGLIEATPEIAAYLQRFSERPAVQRARSADQALVTAQ